MKGTILRFAVPSSGFMLHDSCFMTSEEERGTGIRYELV
jgi:hypothetical protein